MSKWTFRDVESSLTGDENLLKLNFFYIEFFIFCLWKFLLYTHSSLLVHFF